jgi:cell division protein FtsZ
VQLGRNVTRGLGAGSRPEVGRAATEESLREIVSAIEGAQMVFITAGMGGGTGTGGAPVVAQATREAGVLTVGVVTKPFDFEGARRMRVAEAGIAELGKQVDTLIVIPNQNLFRVADEKTTFADAFRIADEVLHSGVRGVTDLVVMPGLINLDFADIQSVMAEMGKAIMGTGEAEGENRALEAAEAAISNPLLDEISMQGARGVLINIAGGIDLTLFEVDQAANRIREEVDPDANIIFGSVFDQRLEGRMRVSVVATGIETEVGAERPKAVPLSLIVSRSVEDKPAWQKASQEPAGRPAQPTPGASGADAETAPDDVATETGTGAERTDPETAEPKVAEPEAAQPEAAKPEAVGDAKGVSAIPGRGPEEAVKTPPFHSVAAPGHRPSEPPEPPGPTARGTADVIRSPEFGEVAASASDVVALDSAQSKPATGEPSGTSPAPAGGAADAPASDRDVDAPGLPAEPSAAETPPTSDPVRKWRPLFKAGPKPAPQTEADVVPQPAAAVLPEPPPKVKDASIPTLDTRTIDAAPGPAATSESQPRKRRSSGFFSWMSGRGGTGAEEHFEKGDRHYYGQGVRKNQPLALRWYRKAADLGHAAAQNRLGWMYEKGEGVEADYSEAVKWYRRAAEQGHVNAMNDLGYMYRQGWGATQSYSEALRWFRKAAEKYDSYAEYNMGQMYENGWGVAKDLEEGIRWFRRSAARGHEWAARRLEELGVKT